MPTKFRRTALVAALLTLAATAAEAKVKGCFSDAEHKAEWDIRQGLRMREAASRCATVVPGIDKKWEQVDQKLGSRFKSATDRRAKAFAREFPDKPQVAEWWDGRIVTYFRNYPANKPWCEEMAKQMDEALGKGWTAVQSQSKLNKDEVRNDYKLCR